MWLAENMLIGYPELEMTRVIAVKVQTGSAAVRASLGLRWAISESKPKWRGQVYITRRP